MNDGVARAWEEFEELRSRGLEAAEQGRFAEAEAICRRVLVLAEDLGDQHHVDLATCNLAAVAIHQGDGEAELPRLREILVRGTDTGNCRLAAYNISVHYLYAKNYKKSAFYARIALDRARLGGRPEGLATCHNQLGLALISESLTEEASREFQSAVELFAGEATLRRAQALGNLGYCRVLQGRFQEGYSLLYASLRTLRRLRIEPSQAITLLDLAFAHLETGRHAKALRCAALGLRIAERTGQSEYVKNGLYLLGEAANLTGDLDEARRQFARLQEEFYPDASYLPGFLLAVDIRKLINLRA